MSALGQKQTFAPHKTPFWPGEAVYTECRVEIGEGSSLFGAPFTLELAADSLNSMPDGHSCAVLLSWRSLVSLLETRHFGGSNASSYLTLCIS
jgi:hypothetical protein